MRTAKVARDILGKRDAALAATIYLNSSSLTYLDKHDSLVGHHLDVDAILLRPTCGFVFKILT